MSSSTLLLEKLERPLRHLFRTTRPVLPFADSASGIIEGAVRNGVRERMLAVIGGPRGERLAHVAEACGKEVVRAFVAPGRTIEPAHLERFLDGPDVDAVSLAHVEAATGSLAPLEALARVVRTRRDVMLLVDAGSSLGGDPLEMDLWQLDFVFAASEECPVLPSGLSLAVTSKRLAARARTLDDRGWCFDVVRAESAVRRRDPEPLPGEPLLERLDTAMESIAARGGMEAGWRRHAELASRVHAWADTHPALSLVAPPGRRSATISTIQLADANLQEPLLAAWAADSQPLAEPLDEVGSFRIRHGDCLDDAGAGPARLDALLAWIDELLTVHTL
ncbi:MAG TPA: aminotransferase class V-fold PLP-dependent enzyme [Gemmatimonadales bacterium]|nr:aminotransferase class V-fold PLP-dependent enzyme [Gemmatimonadales bacterium]